MEYFASTRNIGWLDKISITSPADKVTGKVTGGILWFFSGRENIKISRKSKLKSRGYIKLYPEAEHVSWIRLGVEQYRTSEVAGIRLSTISESDIIWNRGARYTHASLYTPFHYLSRCWEKLLRDGSFVETKSQLPAHSKIKRSRDFGFKTSSRFPRYWVFKCLSRVADKWIGLGRVEHSIPSSNI